MFMFVPLRETCLRQLKGAAYCKIRSAIRFLKARNVLPSEILYEILLDSFYSETVLPF